MHCFSVTAVRVQVNLFQAIDFDCLSLILFHAPGPAAVHFSEPLAGDSGNALTDGSVVCGARRCAGEPKCASSAVALERLQARVGYLRCKWTTGVDIFGRSLYLRAVRRALCLPDLRTRGCSAGAACWTPVDPGSRSSAL